MLNEMPDKLYYAVCCGFGLFHRQHAIQAPNELVIEGVFIILLNTSRLYCPKRVDQFSVRSSRLLRLLEDLSDSFGGIYDNHAGHIEVVVERLRLIVFVYYTRLVIGLTGCDRNMRPCAATCGLRSCRLADRVAAGCRKLARGRNEGEVTVLKQPHRHRKQHSPSFESR